MRLESERRRFVGLNVKRTLKRPAIEHDLDLVGQHAGVLAFQEFITRGHWSAFRRQLGRFGWKSYPSVLVGLVRPVWSGQAIAWRRGLWRKIDTRRRRLHQGAAGISEPRQLRAVLLEDRTSGLAMWFGTTHFVVAGDQDEDGRLRRVMLLEDLVQLERFLEDLQHSGHAGAFQLDANLTASSDVWPAFQRLLRRRGCTMHGVRGVEYLITWQGTWQAGDDFRGQLERSGVDVETDTTIGTDELETDHEARGIVFRLTGEAGPA